MIFQYIGQSDTDRFLQRFQVQNFGTLTENLEMFLKSFLCFYGKLSIKFLFFSCKMISPTYSK